MTLLVILYLYIFFNINGKFPAMAGSQQVLVILVALFFCMMAGVNFLYAYGHLNKKSEIKSREVTSKQIRGATVVSISGCLGLCVFICFSIHGTIDLTFLGIWLLVKGTVYGFGAKSGMGKEAMPMGMKGLPQGRTKLGIFLMVVGAATLMASLR